MMRRRKGRLGANTLRGAAPAWLFVVAGTAAVFLAPAPAQGQGWSLETQAGRVRYDVGPSTLGVSNLILGLRYAGLDRTWLQASSAVPLQEEDPFWGALAGGARASRSLGRFDLGVDLAGYGFLQADRSEGADLGPLPLPGESAPENSGFGFTGEAMPLVSLPIGAARLEARAGGALYHSSFADSAFTRTVALSDARLTFFPTLSTLVAAEARLVRADGESFPYAGASAVASVGQLSIWGSGGRWLTDLVDTTPWSVGVSLAIGPRLEAIASARQDAYDPLYQSLPRRSWSVGASLALGGAGPSLAEPVPSAYRDGQATIALDSDDAPAAPSVAGDFTGWEPRPMQRVGDEWRWTGPLEPGVYHFAFVTAEGEWFVPEGYPGRQDDGMGGWVAVLVVEGS